VPNLEFAHVPLLFMLGAIIDEARVVDGNVVVRKTMTITATVDHRYADGALLARTADDFKRYMADPRHQLAAWL
jgi:pyruvate/2-oxoglutarate dehydrogenase complex dihydrolipoamide acyltransferase (E2) component